MSMMCVSTRWHVCICSMPQHKLLLLGRSTPACAMHACPCRDGDSCQAAPAQTSALVTFSPACHEVASTPSSCTALDQRRSFSLAYARMLERDYNYRNDVVDMYGQLTDYLIKVVPKWIRFGVAGPAQSNTGSYQEPTLYTDPEYIVPLCRWVQKGLMHSQCNALVVALRR